MVKDSLTTRSTGGSAMKEPGQMAYEAWCHDNYPWVNIVGKPAWARVEATIRADEKAKHEDALRAAAEREKEYREALENLLDAQNGPPLIRYEVDWQMAVDAARAVLEKHKEQK